MGLSEDEQGVVVAVLIVESDQRGSVLAAGREGLDHARIALDLGGPECVAIVGIELANEPAACAPEGWSGCDSGHWRRPWWADDEEVQIF